MATPEVRDPRVSIPRPDHVEPVRLVTDHDHVTGHGLGQRGRRTVQGVDAGTLAGSFHTAPSHTHVEVSPLSPGRPTSTAVPSVESPAIVAFSGSYGGVCPSASFDQVTPTQTMSRCPRPFRRSSAHRVLCRPVSTA